MGKDEALVTYVPDPRPVVEPPDDTWLPRCHFENQRKIAPEVRTPYAGRYIAWSWEGDRIVASGETREELFAEIECAGLNRSRVVVEYVYPLDSIAGLG